MRSRLIPLVAAPVVIVLTAAALHALPNQRRPLPLDRQNLGVLVGEKTTSKTSFGNLGGWGPSGSMHVYARGGIAATLSVTVSAGPVEFRLFLEDVYHDWSVRLMRPTYARFEPGTGTASYSFTFVAATRPGNYTVNIAWRSPDGVEVTLHEMSLVVQYGEAEPAAV